jgi:hypothetical protein
MKVGKIDGIEGARQKKEILDALKKLGEAITVDEEIYLKQYSDGGNSNFAKMSDSSGRFRRICSIAKQTMRVRYIF